MPDGEIRIGKHSEFDGGQWFKGDLMGVGGDDPIAWMPLPKPYDGKEKDMGELTKYGYDLIIDSIVNRTVTPPQGMDCGELNAWLTGYTDCQNAILDLIDSLKNQHAK